MCLTIEKTIMTPLTNGSQAWKKAIEAFPCVAISTIDVNLIEAEIEAEIEAFIEYDLEEELYMESYMPIVSGRQISDELEKNY